MSTNLDKQINETISANLTALMEQRSVTQADLADYMQVSQATISNWCKGIKMPRMDKLDRLCEFFGVSRSYLMDIKPQTPKRSAVRVPVYGRIPAGIPMEAIEDVLGFEELGAEYNKMDKEYFALEIKGDSMSPKYQSGDIVIFERTSDCENGEDCAVRINGDDATFKKVRKQTDGIILQPLNADYAPITVDYANPEFPIEIIGVAKEIRRKL